MLNYSTVVRFTVLLGNIAFVFLAHAAPPVNKPKKKKNSFNFFMYILSVRPRVYIFCKRVAVSVSV